MQKGDETAQGPETWTRQRVSGNELGAELPRESKGWPRCGENE